MHCMSARAILRLSIIALSLLQVSTVSAQQGETRIALVIGNSTYPDADAPFPRAINDATAIAEEFRGNNFTVELRTNLSKVDMEKAIEAFSANIKKGATALFYFSGLGIQAAHQTYLLPVDAQIWTEADVRSNGISADRLLANMHRKGAKIKIVILDAARRNPYERRFRSVPAGLAPLSAPTGSLVIYSGALNKLIDDRNAGGHSLFAAELIKELRSGNGSAEDIFNRTRIAVSRASYGEQVPWVASSLLDRFYVSGRNAGGSEQPPPPPQPSMPPVSLSTPPQVLLQTVPKNHASARGLPGKYTIDGTNPNGSRYGGKVIITAEGATYKFLWRISNGDTYRGRGRLRGDTLTVDWGQKYPVIYRVTDDGTLRGRWANGRGIEILVPD
jgi:Caspase domain